jgi:hypothetical protein
VAARRAGPRFPVLCEALPAAFGPYLLVGADQVKREEGVEDLPYQVNIAAFHEWRRVPGRYQCWIGSEALSGPFPAVAARQLDAWYSLNGLVLLQHGTRLRLRHDPGREVIEASRLGLITAVEHVTTGEVRRYPAYDTIFQTLKRAIQRDLHYGTELHFPDGTVMATPHVRMTEGAVQLVRTGARYRHQPCAED